MVYCSRQFEVVCVVSWDVWRRLSTWERTDLTWIVHWMLTIGSCAIDVFDSVACICTELQRSNKMILRDSVTLVTSWMSLPALLYYKKISEEWSAVRPPRLTLSDTGHREKASVGRSRGAGRPLTAVRPSSEVDALRQVTGMGEASVCRPITAVLRGCAAANADRWTGRQEWVLLWRVSHVALQSFAWASSIVNITCCVSTRM
jgi:hypothetical protein